MPGLERICPHWHQSDYSPQVGSRPPMRSSPPDAGRFLSAKSPLSASRWLAGNRRTGWIPDGRRRGSDPECKVQGLFAPGIGKCLATRQELLLPSGVSGQLPDLPTIPQLLLSTLSRAERVEGQNPVGRARFMGEISSVHECAGSGGLGRLAAGRTASRSFRNGAPQMRN
jgi:hypothetical protein